MTTTFCVGAIDPALSGRTGWVAEHAERNRPADSAQQSNNLRATLPKKLASTANYCQRRPASRADTPEGQTEVGRGHPDWKGIANLPEEA